MSLASLELSGIAALAGGKSSTLDDARLLEHAGLFGVNMFVCGLGLRALSEHHEAGTVLMKLGSVLGATMYGTRYLATDESGPKAGAMSSSTWLPVVLAAVGLGAVGMAWGWGAPPSPDSDPRRAHMLDQLHLSEMLLARYPKRSSDPVTRRMRMDHEEDYRRYYRELFGEEPSHVP